MIPYFLFSQTSSSSNIQQEEAPETVFETQLGDAEVDLVLDGFWDASVKGSLGIAVIPGKGVQYPSVFPGFSDGLIYEQKPDLKLTLWLMERYFFETSIQEKNQMNTYVVGYQGKEGEFIQSIRAGNMGIEISPYPYMDFPGSSKNSPGIAAVFETSDSRHEALLRYDPSLPVKKTYLGKNAVEEVRIDLSAYIKGKYFILPDTDIPMVEVYIEDAEGAYTGSDRRRYRKGTSFDVSVSLSEGLISLDKSSAGRVLVYYEKAGLPVGSSSLGKKSLPSFIKTGTKASWEIDPLGEPEDFSWDRGPYLDAPISRFQVTLGGKACLLVYDPGTFSPFQDCSSYSIQDTGISSGTNTQLKIVEKGANTSVSLSYPVQPVLIPVESCIRMVLPEGNRRSFQARYPFAEEAPLLYGPDSLKEGGGVDLEILYQSYTAVQAYSLSPDVIPGSVRVFRNGREESLFSVDYEKGTVSLPFEPASSDRIEIYYRTASGEGSGGDVLFGTGTTIRFSDTLGMKLALGGRWNVLKGEYSTEPTDHPGTVGASAQITYLKENLNLVADGAALYYNPDTSGLLRLLGMEQYDLTLEISKNNAFPSSIPDTAFFEGALNQSNRGKLFFKNYETIDLLGGTSLNSYTWNPPSSAVFSYEDGSFPGPYTASASSEGFSRVLVLDYEMDASESWVGAQMNLNTGFDAALDLSDVTAIRFAYKVVSHTGAEGSLYFQTGSLDEDLDGDGILDEETGSSSRGYPFNQDGIVLYVGAGQKGLGNDIKDSEDVNRNDILERENSDLVFPGPSSDAGRFSSLSSAAGTGWKTGLVRIPYTERNRLKAVRAVRFIVQKEGSGETEGKILIGPVVFEGTTLPHRVVGSGEVQLREIAESLADVPPPVPLTRVDRDRLKTFHSGGADQKVLEVHWKDLGTLDRWEISVPTTEVPPDSYQEVNLYLRTGSLKNGSVEEGATAVYSFQFTDAEGAGAKVEIPVTAENQWEKLKVDLVRKKAYLGDQELSTVQVDSNFGKLSRFRFSGTGSSEGILYMDELYFSSPQAGWGFAGSFTGSFTLPGTVVSVGELPLLRNLSLSEKISARTESFQGRLEDETPSTLSSSSEGSGDLLGVLYTEGSFAFDKLDTGYQYEGGHGLRFPAEGGILVLQDRFKRSYKNPSESLSRMNRIDFNLGSPVSLGGMAESTLSEETLVQSWEVSGTSTPIPSLSFRLTTHLGHEAEGYLLYDEPYSTSWFRSYELLSPYTSGSNLRREGLARLETQLQGEPWGFRISPEVSYENTGEIDGLQRTVEKILLEIPFRFRKDPYDPGISLTLSYLRQGASTRSVSRYGDFLSDFHTVGDAVQDQTYFYRSYPFYELVTPGRWSKFTDDTRGFSSAEYISQVGTSFSRSYGSLWHDLFLPSQAEGTLKKTLTRANDTVTSTHQVDLAAINSALNLFGRAGAYPVTSLWFTDEYQLKNTLSLLRKEEESSWDWEFSTEQKVSLFGEKEDKAELEHMLYMENTEQYSYWGTLTVSYTWRRELQRDFGLSLLQSARENGAYYLNSEKTEFRYENKEGWKTYLVVGHETALTFPTHGYIKMELNLGLGFEEDYSGLAPGYRLLLGLAFGISAHFIF